MVLKRYICGTGLGTSSSQHYDLDSTIIVQVNRRIVTVYEIEDLEGITESREESGRQKSADLSGTTGLLTSSRLIA